LRQLRPPIRCGPPLPIAESGKESLWQMSNMANFQPDGWHTVTPRIVVRNPEDLIRFLSAVFHAQGEFRAGLPAEI